MKKRKTDLLKLVSLKKIF